MMYQLPERLYKSLDSVVLMLRFRLPFPMLAYPFYLANRSPGKSGSHFHPANDLHGVLARHGRPPSCPHLMKSRGKTEKKGGRGKK